MSTVCCECGLLMGVKEGEGVSHGLCDKCMKTNHPEAYRYGRDRKAMDRRNEAYKAISSLLNTPWRTFP